MLTNIPFIYINIIALCCFFLMFVTFLVSQKTPAIKVFIVVLLDCILWSGSSVLMRVQMWPGMNFWYYLSLVTLFVLDFLFYWFVHSFYRQKGKFSLFLAFIGTVAIIPGTISGFFLAPPKPVMLNGGKTVFIYSLNWHIVIPCVLFLIIIGMTAHLFLKLAREHGIHSPGLLSILWGGLVLLTGNLLQVAIPGNTFPYDALSGIIFSALLIFALYKRRMFRLTLIISRGILMAVLVIVCIAMSTYLISPLHKFALSKLRVSDSTATFISALVFTGVLLLIYHLLRKLIDAVFTREEQQGKQVSHFSNAVSQSLNTSEIMNMLSDSVMAEVCAEKVYICQLEGKAYVAKKCSNTLESVNFSISADSPHVFYLKEQEDYLMCSEFQSSPLYLSVWDEEKDLFRRLGIDCLVAIKSGKEIIGLLLLCAKDRGKDFNYTEITYLETICSVSAIAMKNAGLYEKMFHEARIDPLTGIYNYRYFVERESELFDLCKDDCLSLLFVDIDDLKLYNQLYGVEEGNNALCLCSKVLTLCVGSQGEVFRTSGKVFGILLPHTDSRKAKLLADELGVRVRAINHTPERRKFKNISVSIGICTAPYTASTAKELIDNADLATYSAKQSGKDCIVLFKESAVVPHRLSERTEAILERIDHRSEGSASVFDMISALTAAIDAKDHYTFNHSKNVARYAANLAVSLGLNDDQVRTIYIAGLLHDIGKISIPEYILRKTEQLTAEEYRIMRDHVNNSVDMIRHLPNMDYVIPAVLGHHERWDGQGYPRGIHGDEIPVSARCLAIADAFDAMITDRPYRKGRSTTYAVAQLRAGAGTQFDPQIVEVFSCLIEDNEIRSI